MYDFGPRDDDEDSDSWEEATEEEIQRFNQMPREDPTYEEMKDLMPKGIPITEIKKDGTIVKHVR